MVSRRVIVCLGSVAAVVLLLVSAGPPSPTPLGELRGRVAGEDGKPLARALVRVAPETEDPDAPAKISRVTTAEDGSFLVRDLRSPSLVVRVEAKGLAPFTASKIPVGASLRVSLKKGFSLSGVVRDLATRQGISDATVLACDPEAVRFGEDACRRAQSLDAGRFRIDDLPRGSVSLAARAAARATTRLERS